MPRPLTKILSEAQSAGDLRAAHEEVEAERSVIESELSELEAAHTELMLNGPDGDLDALDQRILERQRQVNRCELLSAELSKAIRDRAQAERQAEVDAEIGRISALSEAAVDRLLGASSGAEEFAAALVVYDEADQEARRVAEGLKHAGVDTVKLVLPGPLLRERAGNSSPYWDDPRVGNTITDPRTGRRLFPRQLD